MSTPPTIDTLPPGWIVFSTAFGATPYQSDLLIDSMNSMVSSGQFQSDQLKVLQGKRSRWICVPSSAVPSTFNAGHVREENEHRTPLLRYMTDKGMLRLFKHKANAGQTDTQILDWLRTIIDPNEVCLPKRLVKIRQQIGCATAPKGGARPARGKYFMRVSKSGAAFLGGGVR